MIPESIGPSDLFYALALSAAFAGMFLLVSVIFSLVVTPWRRRREVAARVHNERLTLMARSGIFQSGAEGQKTLILKIIEKVFGRERLARLQLSLFQADIYTGLPRFIYLVILCACAGFIAASYFRSLLFQIALGLICGYLPFLYLRYRRARKTKMIEKQMPDAMELIARSLRAGHTLPSAVDLAAQEIFPPLGSELRLAHEEQRLGLTMPEALDHMAGRTDSKDLQYFVSAINIQNEVGGNLAELMETIGSLIRDRLNLKAKVMALTGQMRLSATILSILPFVVFFIVYRIVPDYAGELLTDPVGKKLTVASMLFICLGSIIMRKLVNIKV